MIRITDTIGIEERELDERFVRASGPGGQNVNKVSTAVELRFDVRASSLPYDMKQRLIALAGSRMTGDEVLLIDSREHRTQAMNREAARARLVALLQHGREAAEDAPADQAETRREGKAAGVQAPAERGQVAARPRAHAKTDGELDRQRRYSQRKRVDRIDARRPQRRQPDRDERDRGQDHRHRHEDDRIPRGDAEQQALDQPRQRQRRDQCRSRRRRAPASCPAR